MARHEPVAPVKLAFFVEGDSDKEFLEGIVQRILGPGVHVRVVRVGGKAAFSSTYFETLQFLQAGYASIFLVIDANTELPEEIELQKQRLEEVFSRYGIEDRVQISWQYPCSRHGCSRPTEWPQSGVSIPGEISLGTPARMPAMFVRSLPGSRSTLLDSAPGASTSSSRPSKHLFPRTRSARPVALESLCQRSRPARVGTGARRRLHDRCQPHARHHNGHERDDNDRRSA